MSIESKRFNPEEVEVARRLNIEWKKTIGDLGGNVEKSGVVFKRIVEAYRSGDGRAYHNLFHIDRMLGVVNKFPHLAEDLPVLKAAIFGHDIVYVPGSQTNERDSADLFGGMLRELGVDEDRISKSDKLIMVTENHKTSEDDRDGRLIIDADFDILGSDTEVYRNYSQGIYTEYVLSGRVSPVEFKSGRTNAYLNPWLESIKNNSLYLNPEIGEVLNPQAEKNILLEKEWLESL